MQQLFSHPSVTWGDFDSCAYGLKDPESGLRSLKPTSLMRCLPPEAMRPFSKCTNFTGAVKHQHQPLEGNAGTLGSRAKLAQVYPYQFCQDLAHIILRHLKVKSLDNEVCSIRKEMEAIDKEFNMTSSSDAVKIQDLPFNKNVQPQVIQDSLVQKFQKTMKQYPPRRNRHFATGPERQAMPEHVKWLREVETTLHLIHSMRRMHGIQPYTWH